MKVFIYSQLRKRNVNDLIDEMQYIEYVYQLADVIAYLHNRDCIYLDLKPM